MGLSFPILQRAVQDDPRTAGHKVGILQAANIAGCVAGSLLVGLVLLDRIGTPGTVRGLLGVGYTPARVLAMVDTGAATAEPRDESEFAAEVRLVVERIVSGIAYANGSPATPSTCWPASDGSPTSPATRKGSRICSPGFGLRALPRRNLMALLDQGGW